MPNKGNFFIYAHMLYFVELWAQRSDELMRHLTTYYSHVVPYPSYVLPYGLFTCCCWCISYTMEKYKCSEVAAFLWKERFFFVTKYLGSRWFITDWKEFCHKVEDFNSLENTGYRQNSSEYSFFTCMHALVGTYVARVHPVLLLL